MQPLSYQADCLEALDDARKKRRKKALVVMATGLGKTVVSAFEVQRLLKRRAGRVLYLCHQNDILRQARATFEKVLGDSFSYGYFHGTEKHLHRVDVLFASFQTMATSRTLFDASEFDYIVVDEVHHAHAATFRPTVEYFQPRFMIGLTATPERGDGLDITELFGKPVYELGLFKALALGHLCEVDYRVMTDEIQNTGILDTPVGKLSLAELNRTIFIPKRDEEIVRVIAEKIAEVQNPRVMIFCASIEHAERMTKLMPHAAMVHSKLNSDEKKRRLDAFRSGAIDTVLTVDMLNEGIDVPQASVIIFLRSTASKTIFLQQLGRGLRKALGKLKVLVLDFVANCERIEMIDELVQATKKAVSDLSPDFVFDDDEVEGEQQQRLPLTLTLDGVAFDERLVVLFRVIRRIQATGRSYTREELVEQLKHKATQLGRTPTSMEVNADIQMASVPSYEKAFGSYNGALKAAGLAVNSAERRTRDEIIVQLQDKAEELGRAPLTSEVKTDSAMVSLATIYRVFGTFNKALEEAGLAVKQQKRRFSPEELVAQLQRKSQELGRAPTSKEVDADPSMTSVSVLARVFGGFNKALEAAGLTVERHYQRYSSEQLIEQLRRKAEELGRTPTTTEVDEDSAMASCNVFARIFGSFSNAVESSDLQANRHITYTEDQLIQQLRQKAEELGRTPVSRDIARDPALASSDAFYRVFGTFNEALKAAGFKPNMTRPR